MKVRFLADADLNKAIVNGVLRREPSIVKQSARGKLVSRIMCEGPGRALQARAGTGEVNKDEPALIDVLTQPR
jgi:hypothetical protein